MEEQVKEVTDPEGAVVEATPVVEGVEAKIDMKSVEAALADVVADADTATPEADHAEVTEEVPEEVKKAADQPVEAELIIESPGVTVRNFQV